MENAELILFDDATARRWEPFALTRPVGELIFGTTTFRERVERALGVACVGHLAADHLNGFKEPGAVGILSPPDDPVARRRVYLLSRAVPAATLALPSDFEGALSMSGRIIGWVAAPGAPPLDPDFFLYPEAAAPTGRPLEMPGLVLENVWDLISKNPRQLEIDLEALPDGHGAALPDGAYQWGAHPLILDPAAVVEPGSAFDTSSGPIWIDRDAHVRAFTRLAGPAYVGRGSTLLGGPLEAVSLGPICRVRGELAESVCLGYVNKQHDGHIGHAYLGKWVNLGAETTNSDLKNNYGTIRIWTPAGETDTGEIKMGSLIGDHVKTGIGLLLNTGTVIGAGSNLFGSAMPPTYVPPFSWGSGTDLVEYRLDRFLQVAERAMARRGVELSDGLKAQLTLAWTRGREELGT